MRDIDTLLAVVAGGIHRPVGILRSSLYPIPHREDSLNCSTNSKIWHMPANEDICVGSTYVTLVLKDTKLPVSGGYENSVGYSNVGLIKEVQGGPVPLTINYEEAIGSTFTGLTKRVTKISYSNQIDTSVGSTNVVLTKG